LVSAILSQPIPIIIFDIGWKQPILKRPPFLYHINDIDLTDTKDTLSVDIIDVFGSSELAFVLLSLYSILLSCSSWVGFTTQVNQLGHHAINFSAEMKRIMCPLLRLLYLLVL
jgi:hypothetical protein